MSHVPQNKPDFSQVVTQCYEAAWDHRAWPHTLSVLCDHVGSQAITLESFDADCQTLIDFQSSGIDTGAADEYVNYYLALNPRQAVLKKSQEGDIYFDGKILTEKEMDHSEFYADLLKPAGLRYFLSSTLIRNDSQLVILAEHIATRSGHSSKNCADELRTLAPYFSHAYQLSLHIGALQESIETGRQILDSLDVGISILNQRSQPVYNNKVVEMLCHDHPGISLNGSGFRIRDSQVRKRFEQAIGRALDSAIQPPTESLLIPGDANHPFLRVDITPVCATGCVADRFEASARQRKSLVLIRDVGSRQTMPFEVLKYCFSLTPREIKLAQGLVAGLTLSQYANSAQVKITTVRSQFASLRSKLGARNQADVMRVLMPLLSS